MRDATPLRPLALTWHGKSNNEPFRRETVREISTRLPSPRCHSSRSFRHSLPRWTRSRIDELFVMVFDPLE